MNDYPTTDAIKAVVDALAASDYSDLIPLEFLAPVAQIAVGAAKPEIEGGWRTAVAIDNAVIAELTAELDKVRAQLADTQKRAHTDATNLQQILRDKTALANERDAMREVVEAAKVWREWYGNTNPSYASACNDLAAAVNALTEAEVAR